jgi:serine protease Do
VTIGSQPSEKTISADISKKLGLEVQDLTPELASRMGYEGQEGVLVTSVEPGSLAQMGGLERGDLIQEVNQQKTANTKSFNQALDKAMEAKSILLLVRHGGSSRYLVMKVK